MQRIINALEPFATAVFSALALTFGSWGLWVTKVSYDSVAHITDFTEISSGIESDIEKVDQRLEKIEDSVLVIQTRETSEQQIIMKQLDIIVTRLAELDTR